VFHSFIDNGGGGGGDLEQQQQITQQHGAPAAVAFFFTIILFYNSIVQVVTLSASTIDASSFLLPHKKTIEWIRRARRTGSRHYFVASRPAQSAKKYCCVQQEQVNKFHSLFPFSYSEAKRKKKRKRILFF